MIGTGSTYRNLLGLCMFVLLLISCGKNGKDPEINSSHSSHQGHTKMESVWKDGTMLSSQKIIKLKTASSQGSIELEGLILPDERRNSKVAIRYSGRIERIYVKYPYQYVRKGERLLDIYSAELNTYVKEYIYLLDKKDESLSNKSKQKLALLGLTEGQIDQIENTLIAPFTFTVYAPSDGYLLPPGEVNGMATMNSEESSAMKMDGMSSPKAKMDMNTPTTGKKSEKELWIREGIYVSKDQTLFQINDLKNVWGIAMGNATLMNMLEKNSPLYIISEQNRIKIPARIDFLEPAYEEGQKFTRIRLYIENSKNLLQLNSLFRVEVDWNSNDALTLPESAVLDLGRRKIVWIKIGETTTGTGIFEKREVIAERMSNGDFLITGGLEAGDEVIENAGMLLDSETLVK